MPTEPTIQDVMKGLNNLSITVSDLVTVVNTSSTETQKQIGDILEAVNDSSTEVQKQIGSLEARMDGVEKRLDGIDNRLNGMDQRFGRIESTMVTKSYLDDKLADLRADLITLARKQNRKFESLVMELVQEGRLTQSAADRLLAMEPFPA